MTVISRRSFILSIFGYTLLNKEVFGKKNCKLTPSQPIGPFYMDTKIINNDLTNKGKAKGQKIRIRGNISDNNCNPLSNLKIKIWQANKYGKYNNKNDLSNNKLDENFQGYTTIKTNSSGNYEFSTIIPGGYQISKELKRPPHIHFLIIMNNRDIFSTQLYFKNHPLNSKDFLYNRVKDKNALEVNITKDIDNQILNGTFNIII